MHVAWSRRRTVVSLLTVALLFAALAAASAQTLPQLPQSQYVPTWYNAVNTVIQNVWKSELPYAVAAVALSFGIAGIIFMVGAAAKNDRIREFGQGELYEAIASAIIVVAFLYVSAVMFGVVPGYVVGNINPYATAFQMILSTIQQAEAMFSSMFETIVVNSFYASVSVKLTVGGTFTTNLFQPVYATAVQLLFVQPATTLLLLLNDAILVLYSEYYILVFFCIAAIPAFLVPGVVLRAILPTRALGGMLIAMALAFYLVVPTMFAVAFYFTAPSTISEVGSLTAQINRYGGSGAMLNANSAGSPLVTLVQQAGKAMNGFWLMILFYPMLILAVAYAFIVQVGNFIGGAASTSGKLRAFV